MSLWRHKSAGGDGNGVSEERLAELREAMVREQLHGRGIRDERVLEAMRTVPRHKFVDAKQHPSAYEDRPLPIGLGQTISQPYMVALMTQALAPRAADTVLEVGTGSGYQAAILAALSREVHTVERHPKLAERAAKLLPELGYENVHVHCGDGTLGWTANAPYDRIIVTAGAPVVPGTLEEQLAEGGRLVCPEGPRERQVLVTVERRGGQLLREESIGCMFVPLIGEAGWPQ